MIDHVTIPVSNLELSLEFYRKAFSPLGYKYAFGEAGKFHAFSVGPSLFEICQHHGTEPISSFHIAFKVESHELVKQFYDAAISNGAKGNGEPGPRPQYTPNYFACFVFDRDGHNVEAMFDN